MHNEEVILVAEGEFASHESQRNAVAGLLASHFGHECEVGHTAAGAPYIPGFDGHISISHCAVAVAVAISRNPIGVDIESHRHRQLRRVASRFAPNLEDHDSPTALAAVWGAKEAIFKLYRGERYVTHTEIPYPAVKGCIVEVRHARRYTLAVARW